MSFLPSMTGFTVSEMTAPRTMLIPAGCSIVQIIVENLGGLITGGLKIGTTNGGADVLLALGVGGNSLQSIPDAAILKHVFSMTQDTTLYLQAVIGFGSANVNVYVLMRKFSTL